MKTIDSLLKRHESAIRGLLHKLVEDGRIFWLASDLNTLFDRYIEEDDGKNLKDTLIEGLFRQAQEVVAHSDHICFSLRRDIGKWQYYALATGSLEIKELKAEEFLILKERVLDPNANNGEWVLKFDLYPFSRDFPRMREKRSIGRGVEYLNRYLSGRLFIEGEGGDRKLHEFLRIHQYRQHPLMLNGRVDTLEKLRDALGKAERMLAAQPKDATWNEIAPKMKSLGFEPGWGNNAARALESVQMLTDILEAPSPDNLQSFLSRIPMIFSIVILSPHGFFAQENVLGLPDTGGQIVYILDQVRALEKEMLRRAELNGLDIEPQIIVITRQIPESRGTTCDQPRERIKGSKFASIVRVPFRDAGGNVVPHWISRFRVWPYLERFAADVEMEIRGELGGRPDLLIGNYSDGNLVATLLSRRLGVTQCNIAHALEKTKYLFSAMYWRENEEQYNFPCHYSADLISMNSADFVITSTYQEIAGNERSIGQYESYENFTMPGLFRVMHGVDIFDPKFNIVSPGADPEVYFPYHQTERRNPEVTREMERVVFEEGLAGTRGHIEDPDKPLIFLISRMDVIKNVTGFMRWYAKHPRLKDLANVLVASGSVNPAESTDDEERSQIELMHRLIDEHGLDHRVRWIGRVTREVGGALYRYVADKRGVFVQPALFEAFGLTVIEAMASGLPTFATRFGGPLEIIEDQVSGFHIDPNQGEWSAERIAGFLEQCAADPDEWKRLSNGAIQRVDERYTWRLYAERLLTLSRIYGFWKFISNLEREETRSYLEMFYGLFHRERARRVKV
ncbi:MAG: sucrose synthase [bacterium]